MVGGSLVGLWSASGMYLVHGDGVLGVVGGCLVGLWSAPHPQGFVSFGAYSDPISAK